MKNFAKSKGKRITAVLLCAVISSRTESKSETVITETDDGNGNIVQTETTVTRTYLYIMVSHKTVDEMAAQYGFNQEQKDYLTELLQDKNNSLWSSVLYGITASDDQIVTVALTGIIKVRRVRKTVYPTIRVSFRRLKTGLSIPLRVTPVIV